MKESKEAMQILNIDHLGIVAGIIDEMELVEEVNKMVGIKIKEILTPGQVMKAQKQPKLKPVHTLQERLNQLRVGISNEINPLLSLSENNNLSLILRL
jgi:hypothetical protein